MPNKQLIINSQSLSTEQKVVSLLGCVAHEHKTEMEALVSRHGLSLLQLEILHCLDQAPQEELSVGQLKSKLIDDSPNVSRTLNLLVGRGLVTKRRCTEDQRTVYIAITPAGHDAHERSDKELSSMKTALSSAEIKQLYTLLQKF
ncbi:MarR family transcriptional regulator [Sphingorhabdus sp. Alg231-15]|uniref:MarR family transcriptional regulator n=1 Tax=Sphingorhabdus sp. Alg231-15 TaxID=1922222 RepID=UPI000D54C9C3